MLVCILGNKVWFADMGNRVWNSKGGLKPRDGYRENYMHACLISHGTSRVQQQLGNRETSIGIEQTRVFFFKEVRDQQLTTIKKGKVGVLQNFLVHACICHHGWLFGCHLVHACVGLFFPLCLGTMNHGV